MDPLLDSLSAPEVDSSSNAQEAREHTLLHEHEGHAEDHVEHPKTCCGSCAASVIAKVLEAHRVLHTERDLSPRNPIINCTLGGLVRALTDAQTDAQSEEDALPRRAEQKKKFTEKDVAKVLLNSRVIAVRATLLEKLSAAETEMELYFAKAFLETPKLEISALHSFIYWDNYECLVRAEVEVIRKLIDQFADSNRTIDRSPDIDGTNAECSECSYSWHSEESIAVVGSGPLPLTAIILHQKLHVAVTCVDRDPKASRLANDLISRLHLQSEIRTSNVSGTFVLSVITYLSALV